MRKSILCILLICILSLLSACSVETTNLEKLRDIEFTVVEEDDVPQELQEKMKEKQETRMRMTYADKGYLYIAMGYGVQETSGYSIEVKECYETSNAIYIHTNLLGPAKDEKIVESKTYPSVVVKMEFIDKNVVFK